jgi:hypothetical protein
VKKVIDFEWMNIPERTVIVFDEAHYCKNVGTQRTQLLLSAYDYAKHPENRWKKINIILLSATIIEKKINLLPFMYVLGFAKTPKEKTILDNPNFSVREFGYKLMVEKRLTRATMKEAREALADFHTSDVRTKMFQLNEEDRQKIQALCQNIRDVLKSGEGKKSKNHLAVRLKARQEIEALKMGIIFNELKTQRAANYAVGVFVNFLQSHEALISMIRAEMPDEPISVIKGGQEAFERLRQVDDFQEGRSNIMITMITAGGIGIGLHDVNGVRKRYGLHSPPESATQTVQAIGRMDRLGSKSDSVQRLVFIKDTIEEKVAEGVLKKMQTIGDLNGEEDSADNIFLFDVVHNYEEAPVADTVGEAGQVRISVDKKAKQMVVTVPDYMVDAFENGMPQIAKASVIIEGEKYRFKMEYYAIIQEFLEKLIH